MPKTNIRVKLAGEDGNAFAILARVKRALIKGGFPELAEEYVKAATAGSYEDLLRVTMEYVEESDD